MLERGPFNRNTHIAYNKVNIYYSHQKTSGPFNRNLHIALNRVKIYSSELKTLSFWRVHPKPAYSVE